METLLTLYPNVQDLLATPPEDLAPVLLKLARGIVRNGMFWPDAANDIATGSNSNNPVPGQPPRYPFDHRQQIDSLLTQTWSWIERNGLIARASGMNGGNGWMIFTQQGERVSDAQDIQRLREAADFPRWMIHESIAEKVWRALMRNDLGDAVLFAFRAVEVEEAVRSAGGFTANDYGVKLMRDAFNKDKGPLTDLSQPDAEREGLQQLFAGAILSYKNPHSHRTVDLTDIREAQEQVVLASHLLRIVDARRKP